MTTKLTISIPVKLITDTSLEKNDRVGKNLSQNGSEARYMVDLTIFSELLLLPLTINIFVLASLTTISGISLIIAPRYFSLPEIGGYTSPVIFDNKKVKHYLK